MSNGVKVDGIPRRSLLDERLRVRVRGLEPSSPVTLHLNVTNGINLNFDSVNAYRTDEEGHLDLERSAPLQLGGQARTYSKTVDSMGIFRTLQPCETDNSGGGRGGGGGGGDGGGGGGGGGGGRWDHRFWSADVSRPTTCSLSIYVGAHRSRSELEGLRPVACHRFDRRHLAEGVTRAEVREGRVRGTLFLPRRPEGRRVPVQEKSCVVTLHGGIKNKAVCEDLAALFASRGFPSLALGYFGIGDLPRKLYDQPMDMKYLEEAVDYVTSLPGVDGGGVGLFGISKGAEVCQSMCAFFGHKVRAAALVNTMVKVFGVSVVYGAEEIPPCSMGTGVKVLGDNVVSIWGSDAAPLATLEDPSSIPFWRCPAPVLFVASGDDGCINAAAHAQQGKALAELKGKTNCRVLNFPGMGHLVDLPFSPVATTDNNPMLGDRNKRLYYGGEDFELHSQGQERVWEELLSFYRENLKC